MTAKKVDWENVRRSLNTKPDTWKCQQLVEFLSMYGLANIAQTISKIIYFFKYYFLYIFYPPCCRFT